jgi:hypothetical protein
MAASGTPDRAIQTELSGLALGLASYLAEAGQVDRLMRLFADDRWLQRRVDPDAPDWDGYQQDIDAAWNTLDQALAAPETADPMPNLVRLALVRATLSSAEDIPPALVVAAVSTGHWSVERAVAALSRHPSPDQRARTLCELLRITDLTREARQAISTRILELAWLPARDLPAEALLSGLELLDPAQRITVADRIAADAIVAELRPEIVPGLTGPHLSPWTAVQAMEAVPEARRPVLITKIAEQLLHELAPPERAAPPQPTAAPGDPRMKLLVEQQFDDIIRSTWDPGRARDRAVGLLTRMVPLVAAHPDRRRLLDRVTSAIKPAPGGEQPADADDAETRRRALAEQMRQAVIDSRTDGGGQAGPDGQLQDLDEMSAQWLSAAFAGSPDELSPGPTLPEMLRLATSPQARAALLITALDRHFRMGTILLAWRGVAPGDLAEVDWSLVLAYALPLPVEEQRQSFGQLLRADPWPSMGSVPRLAALRLVLPHLTDDQVGTAFTNLAQLEDPDLRRIALGLIAPRLNAAQVARALQPRGSSPDAREQAWFLGELASVAPDARKPELESWSMDAVAATRSGEDFGFAATLPADRVLTAVQAMDYNNRVDAIAALTEATSGPLPPAIVSEVLQLPVINQIGKYSPRAWAISTVADRIPEDQLAATMRAALEIPRRTRVGDSQAMGVNWGHEYPQAGALTQLAPRLRGELAEAAFAASRELPWIAREELLQKLVPQADEGLARAIFDYSVEVHQTYLGLPDSAPVPYELEGTFVTEPLPTFKDHREVALAETIAAIAARLDPARLDHAITQCQAFHNAGPRSWLPARLLPHLSENRREAVLGPAIIAALEFITDDPSRLDLLTDLMPYTRAETDRRKNAVYDFVEGLIPGQRDYLTARQLKALPRPKRQAYLTLMGADRADEMEKRMRSGEADDAATREYLSSVVLSPVFAETFQDLLTSTLSRAPLDPRIRALGELKQILDPPAHASVVAATLREVVETPTEPTEWAEQIAGLLSFLDAAARNALVDAVFRLPGLPDGDDEALCAEMADIVLRDMGDRSGEDPRFDEDRDNLLAIMVRQSTAKRHFDTFLQRRSLRVRLLAAIAPSLPEAALRPVVERMLGLPAVERADGIAALLEKVHGEPRQRLVRALPDVESPFGRLWALFASQEALRDGPDLAALARATAESFTSPKNVVVSLLMLAGYAGAEVKSWMKQAIALSDTLAADDRRRVMALITPMLHDDRDLTHMVIDSIRGLPTPEAVHAALVTAASLGLTMSAATPEQAGQLRAAGSRRLRFAAQRGRTSLLRTLTHERAGFTALSSPHGIYEMGRATRDICTTWHWVPSA